MTITIGTIVVAALLGIAILRIRSGRRARRLVAERHRQLETRGVTAAAVVEGFERTGWTINDRPEVIVTVVAQIADGQAIRASDKRTVDPLHAGHLEAGKPAVLHYDPEDLDNFEIFLGYEKDIPEPPAIEATGAVLDAPLWTFGTEDLRERIYPPRRGDAATLLIADVDDPHGKSRETPAWVDSAALLLVEALWARSDVYAAAAVFVDLENRKLIEPTGALRDYSDFAGTVESCDPTPVAVWGAAGEDLDRDGVTLKLRKPGEERTYTIAGPLDELVDMLIGWCERHDLGAAIEPPAWYRMPEAGALDAYARHLDYLLLQVLADSENGALAPLDFHADIVGNALEGREAHAGDAAAFTRLAATSAIYAARAGKLGLERRLEIERLIDQAAEGDPLRELDRGLLKPG